MWSRRCPSWKGWEILIVMPCIIVDSEVPAPYPKRLAQEHMAFETVFSEGKKEKEKAQTRPDQNPHMSRINPSSKGEACPRQVAQQARTRNQPASQPTGNA